MSQVIGGVFTRGVYVCPGDGVPVLYVAVPLGETRATLSAGRSAETVFTLCTFCRTSSRVLHYSIIGWWLFGGNCGG